MTKHANYDIYSTFIHLFYKISYHKRANYLKGGLIILKDITNKCSKIYLW